MSWKELEDVEEWTEQGGVMDGDGAKGVVEGSEEEAPGEVANAQPLPAPRSPSKAEWDKHVISHIPFRSWCRHCVAGRGIERRHLGRKDVEPDRQPYISIDYGYMAGDATPTLVAKDRMSGMIFAMAVERKGAADPHAVVKLTEWVDALGSTKVSIRSDGEPAIKQVAAAVRDGRREGAITTLENSPPGDHASNGIAERAVGQVTGMVRTLKAELEFNTKGKLGTESRTWAWMINHAACLLNLDTIGEDGKVPFERWRGRRHALQRCVFGEKVWYRPGPLSGGTKAEDRMVEGRFVGFKLRTGEYVVITDGEAVAARTIKRMPEGDRWSEPEKILDVGVLPWDQPGRPRAEAVRPAGERDREEKVVESHLPPPPAGTGHARRVYLKHGDFLEHGLSESCPGCRAIKLGIKAQGHSAACRARMEDALSRSESGKRRLDIAVDRTKDVIGEKAAKRAMLSYSKGHPDTHGQERAASSSSDPLGSGEALGQRLAGPAPSGMNVDESGDQSAKRIKVGDGTRRQGDGGGQQDEAMELADWDGHRILDMSGPEWNFGTERHRAVARELARAWRPHLLRMRWEGDSDDAMEFIWDICHLQQEENMGYLCELDLEASRSGAAYDFKQAMGARDEAVVVRGRSAEKMDTVVLMTNLESIRDRASRAMRREGWMGQEDLDRVVQDCLRDEGEDMIADDAKKGMIPVKLVVKAKEEERAFIEKMGVFDVVDRASARGRRVIKTRWVVTNKGTEEAPNIRARWVAQEFKHMDGPDHGEHYAPTPGLDMVKAVLSHAASSRGKFGKDDDVIVVVVDIRRAYFYAKPAVDTFVELPDYYDAAIRARKCGKLKRCLYGTRPAARSWQRELEDGLKEAGMKIGVMSKCAFRSECGRVVGTMHGDDVLMAGPRSVIEKVRKCLRKRYETREQMISGRDGEPKELVILNRKIQWRKEGIRLAPDQRHAAEVIEELGLREAKPVDTPVCTTMREMTEEEKVPLEGAAASQFRRLAAKLNYLSLDRPDIRYGTSLVCAVASTPRLGDMTRLKRIARFLVGKPVLWTYFRWGVSGSRLYAYTDADWASCKESRRSTSGGMLVHNGALLRFWSRKQKVISLSSWESELYAGVTTGVEAIGLQSGLADFGIRCRATLMSENQGVVDHTARQGLGLAKHVHIRHLWLQTARESGQLDVCKVHTSRNAADVLTKALPFNVIRDLLRRVNVVYDGDALVDSSRCA